MATVPHRRCGPTGIKHGSNTASSKVRRKRIDEADHQLLRRYAASLNVDGALLAPHIDSLSPAREHHAQKACPRQGRVCAFRVTPWDSGPKKRGKDSARRVHVGAF